MLSPRASDEFSARTSATARSVHLLESPATYPSTSAAGMSRMAEIGEAAPARSALARPSEALTALDASS